MGSYRLAPAFRWQNAVEGDIMRIRLRPVMRFPGKAGVAAHRESAAGVLLPFIVGRRNIASRPCLLRRRYIYEVQQFPRYSLSSHLLDRADTRLSGRRRGHPRLGGCGRRTGKGSLLSLDGEMVPAGRDAPDAQFWQQSRGECVRAGCELIRAATFHGDR